MGVTKLRTRNRVTIEQCGRSYQCFVYDGATSSSTLGLDSSVLKIFFKIKHFKLVLYTKKNSFQNKHSPLIQNNRGILR